jgi:REP element-mobilizing transposase RayT
MNSSVLIRSRGYLPHWESQRAIYFVTFRLADSLPRALVEALRSQSEAIERATRANTAVSADQERARKLRALIQKAERSLDDSLGECHMRNPLVAKVVVDALRQFHGQRYDLFSWCVMPNHVHVLFSPREPYRLESILHSWKSYSAHQANYLLSRTGSFWQREYFDHLVRGQSHLLKFAQYIQENAPKAGLQNWPWVGSFSPGTAGVSPASSPRSAGVSAASSPRSAGVSPARRPEVGATRKAPNP